MYQTLLIKDRALVSTTITTSIACSELLAQIKIDRDLTFQLPVGALLDGHSRQRGRRCRRRCRRLGRMLGVVRRVVGLAVLSCAT